MYGPFRFFGRLGRISLGALLAIAMLISTVGTLFAAGTTGTISGTITENKSGLPLAGVHVTAVAPTGTYSGTTDQKGFFSFTGLTPDTYTISFELKGYQPTSVTGITVYADQVQDVSSKLDKSLSTIGQVTSRSPGGAFQPKQTQDTYTVTASQIETIQGRADAISESNLLVSLPGATYDSSGYPVLRGGRENEEGFQFEGIDYTDAFTSQFVNSLALNPSIGSLQLTPGSGDASSGNAGTGTINLISKRGTYPGFGSIQGTIGGPDYDHELGLEYGFATRDGRFSNYFAFQGSRDFGADYGHGTPSRLIGRFFTVPDQVGDDIVDNMVFKFGHNNNQSFQIFYQNEIYNFLDNYGGRNGLTFKTDDPYWLAYAQLYSEIFGPGLSVPQIQKLVSLLPYQASATQALPKSPAAYFQPNSTIKFQYSNNLDSTTFVTAKFYRVAATTTFDFPFDGQDVFVPGFYLDQGGNRTGGAIDITKQLGSKNLVQVGGKYDFLSPTYDWQDPGDGYFAALFNQMAYDFVPTSQGGTGYLAQYLNNVGSIPYNNEQDSTLRQDLSGYVTDTYSPSDKVKIQAGLRLDSSDYRFGSGQSEYYAPLAVNAQQLPINAAGQAVTSDTQPYLTAVTSDDTRPLVVEPRLSASYQLGTRDAVRASYGRSVELASLGDVDLSSGRGPYARFSAVPATEAICGATGNLKCQNYADQLYWANQGFIEGIPYQPIQPATFNNYDFSYSHEFPRGIAFKITPFYRRGYNDAALVASPRLGSNGQPLLNADGTVVLGPNTATNLGVERTTGIEFLLTKEAPVGFSGSLSATYINETSNVIPGSSGEDFFPSIPPASLALGNEYRVGFLSPFQTTLAVQYKSKGGIRINPQIYYERGYPIGQGLLTAAYINGTAYNLPNTNVTNPNGSADSFQYVDPQNPGTLLNPHIDATRGTADTAAAGGVIGHGGVFANITFEYSKPGSRSTVGLQIFNITNNVYNAFGGGNNLVTNTRYQPVATGISGPLSGYSALAGEFPTLGSSYYYPGFDNGQAAYLLRPSYDVTQYELYYNLKI